MKKSELVSALGITAAPKFLAIFTKFIRAKLSASLIGVEGVGIVDQVQSVNTKLMGLTTLSLTVGAKKQIIEGRREKDVDTIVQAIRLFALITLILVSITYTLVLFNFEEASNYFFNGQSSEYFLYVFLVFPLLGLNIVPRAFLESFLKFNVVSGIEFAVMITSLLVFIPMIYFFRVQGAILTIAFTITLTFTLMTVMFFKNIKKEGIPLFARNLKGANWKKLGLELFSITGIVTVLGIIDVAIELWIRGTMSSTLGMKMIGLYAPLIAWNGLINGMFMPFISQYVFPKYGECKTEKELSDLTNASFRLVMLLMTPGVILLIVMAPVLIRIMYSSEFLPSLEFVPFHFAGLLFFNLLNIQKQVFIPVGRLKEQVPFVILEMLGYFSIIFFTVESLGLWSWTMKFTLIPIIVLIAQSIYLRLRLGIQLTFQTLSLMAFAMAAFAAIGLSQYYWQSTWIVGAIVFPLILLFTTEKERTTVKSKVQAVVSRINPKRK